MQVVLKQNFSVHNQLIKATDDVLTFDDAQMVESVNDAEISIRLVSNLMFPHTDEVRWKRINYMTVTGPEGTFHYFVTSVDRPANGVTIVHGKLDLLHTYASSILKLQVAAVRSTSAADGSIDDDQRKFSSDSRVTVVPLDPPTGVIPMEQGFSGQGKYILATSQTGYTT